MKNRAEWVKPLGFHISINIGVVVRLNTNDKTQGHVSLLLGLKGEGYLVLEIKLLVLCLV